LEKDGGRVRLAPTALMKPSKGSLARRHLRRRHQSAVRERNAQQRRLRATDELLVLTGRLISGMAVRTRIVEAKNEPITNGQVLTVLTALPTSSTTPQYSCPIGVGSVTGWSPRYGTDLIRRRK